jgi:hypothetical protein
MGLRNVSRSAGLERKARGIGGTILGIETVAALRLDRNAEIALDINDSGTTIFSTELTIDSTTDTSESAGVPAVISDSALADDAEITIDIVAVGSTNAGKGLKVTLIGTRV